MSKTLKKAALIIGIAAISVATFGAGSTLFPVIGSMIGTGAATGTFLGGTVLGATLGLTAADLTLIGGALVAIGVGPSRSLESTGANDRNRAFVDPNALASFVFGRTSVPLALAFEHSQ